MTTEVIPVSDRWRAIAELDLRVSMNASDIRIRLELPRVHESVLISWLTVLEKRLP